MSIQLQQAQMGVSALSFGGIVGGVIKGIGQIATGNVGGAIGSVIQGFSSGSKPQPQGCQPGDFLCMARAGLGLAPQNGAAAGCAPSGYHLNKGPLPASKKHGAVPAHSIMVRNRHMNALNGSAARRAIRRLKGARKAFRDIERFVAPKSRTTRGSSCGCKRK